MPEGDTVYRAARHLDQALRGSAITRTDVRVPRYATADLTGRVVDAVIARGKHLLLRAGDLTVHSHLKMEGSWHLYRPGTPWKRPAHQARTVIETAEWVAVGFDLGELDIVPTASEHEVVGHLGPDLLGPDWDPRRAAQRLARDPAAPAAVALLDQRNLAGLGNVYANELCFLRGVLPTRPFAADEIPDAVALAHRLITANRDRTERTFTGDLRRGRMTWVYGREGRPCRRCGTPIRHADVGRTVVQERDTYWCPHCQT